MGSLLDKINSPSDVKELSYAEMDNLCSEMRKEIIDTVSSNGGHLSSNLGVVELTVALNRVFDPYSDNIVWDVGHQSYPHKLLTGRYKNFSTIRTEGGISGFPNKKESNCDLFTTGHSSTSISSALGASEADYLQGKQNYTVAIIGDGALTGGLAFEGLNNAGRLKRNFIVILNDNTMSISKNVGSVARHLTNVRTNPDYVKTKHSLEERLERIPFIGRWIARFLRAVKDKLKNFFYGTTTMFEDFGFAYYGPFDGHDIERLIETFQAVKYMRKPVFIHLKTYKGKGYQYAEDSPSVFHGLSGFDIQTGETGNHTHIFSDVFGEKLIELARKDDKICAITAAMDYGTGLSDFKENFKNRFYDVGIAEEHAVTFAGGLAAKGMLPVFAVYSTFLQRAYDELIHDISLQGTKAVIAIDRAGVVGEDGKTHQGVFDSAFLRTVPNITVYSPAFFNELTCQLEHLIDNVDGLSAIRYPRGIELYKPDYFIPTSEPFSEYGDSKEITILTYGRMFSFASEVKERFEKQGIKIKIVKLNQIIPIEEKIANSLLESKEIFFIEEGIKTGGIAEGLGSLMMQKGYKGDYFIKAIENPFVEHAPMYRTLEKLGLSPEGIYEFLLENSKLLKGRTFEKET